MDAPKVCLAAERSHHALEASADDELGMASLINAPVALAVAAGVAPEALRLTVETLGEFGVGTVQIPDAGDSSAGRTATLKAAAQRGGWRAAIVASADGALPAVLADALALPVIRVPTPDGTTSGLPLLQTAAGDLPAADAEGASFATVAIGPAGARNAALLVVSMLALTDEGLRKTWEEFRARQTAAVLAQQLPTLSEAPGL